MNTGESLNHAIIPFGCARVSASNISQPITLSRSMIRGTQMNSWAVESRLFSESRRTSNY